MKHANIMQCINVCKSFIQGENRLTILNNLNLEVAQSQSISIMGSSGSGKSTLLHLLAGLDKPTSGEVIINGQNINHLNDQQKCYVRNSKIGFIYQFHHLLGEFTALENVLMPLYIQGLVNQAQQNYAKDLLHTMGLINRTHHYPAQLSGGERQRVAIARAMINNPDIIFADEPTGNLDNQTSTQVLSILLQLQQELKTSLIIVTHDVTIAKQTTIQYILNQGILQLA